jgi:hypothetical protein
VKISTDLEDTSDLYARMLDTTDPSVISTFAKEAIKAYVEKAKAKTKDDPPTMMSEGTESSSFPFEVRVTEVDKMLNL